MYGGIGGVVYCFRKLVSDCDDEIAIRLNHQFCLQIKLIKTYETMIREKKGGRWSNVYYPCYTSVNDFSQYQLLEKLFSTELMLQ